MVEGSDRETARAQAIDAYVGTRIRLRRTLLGLTQTQLGHALGVAFQQVQKYEKGVDRVTSATLVRLGEVLDVPISFYFDGIPAELAPPPPPPARPVKPLDPVLEAESAELARLVDTLPDRAVRRRLVELTVALAGMGSRQTS